MTPIDWEAACHQRAMQMFQLAMDASSLENRRIFLQLAMSWRAIAEQGSRTLPADDPKN
jgi:hypothetical protein